MRDHHPLKMRRIDIFVSCPADVKNERSVVERVIRSIAVQFNVPVTVSYSNRLRKTKPSDKLAPLTSNGNDQDSLTLCPCFWEYPDFKSEQDYQERIPNTGQYDLVVCILWSRLGTKISPASVMPDGRQPNTATEYEIAWVLDQAKRTPDFPELHVYRNLSTPVAPLEPKAERQIAFQQWDSVQEFFSTWKSESGFADACSEYQDLREFENLFRKHFRDFVTKQLGREIIPRKPAPNTRYWKRNPFRGLQSFDFEDAAIFHGRTKAIGEALDALRIQSNAGRPFVLILGPSGSGKSSLVRAGVVPFLTEVESAKGPWRRATARPGPGGTAEDPFNRLAAALLAEAALPELRDADGEKDLASELRQNPQNAARRVTQLLDRDGLHESECVADEEKSEFEIPGDIESVELARHQRLARLNSEAHLALIVDPLEELFTGDFSPELQHLYIAALVTLIRSGRVFVIATLQSDFYATYQQFPELTELAGSAGKYDLCPPTPEEIGDMIRLPADSAGLRFEEDRTKACSLDKTILNAAVSCAEPLPLLEHLLSELYRKQAARQDGLLRWSDYAESGEFEWTLANHAETLFTTLKSDAQGAFDFVMRHLVSFGSGDQGIRRTVLYRDIASPVGLDSRQKEGARHFVDSYIKEGLLYAEPDLTQDRIVRLSHQALLGRWPRVRRWLVEHQSFLRLRDRLDASLNLWVRRGRQCQNLLGPSFGVTDAETLLRHFRSSLTKTQIEYIEKIMAAQRHDRRIRHGAWSTAGAAFVVLAAVAGIQWSNIETQQKGAQELARIERRIAEYVAESRNGRGSEPRRLKDRSQIVQTDSAPHSDRARVIDTEFRPGKESRQNTDPVTAQRSAMGAESKNAGVQQTAQDPKTEANQSDAKYGVKAAPNANIGATSSGQDEPKPVQNEQNETGESQSDQAIATSSEPTPPETPVDGNTNVNSDEQQLKKFVAEFLQTVASDDVSTQERFFAHRVAYFDQGVISLRRVQAAKESYNHQWPARDWRPQGEAEIHDTNNSRLYEIVQPYTWTASDGSRLDQGSGTLYMRVYKTSKGDFHIVHIERRD